MLPVIALAALLAAPAPAEVVAAALALEEAGQDDEAIGILTRLLEAQPRYVPAMLERARLWLKRGDQLDAVEADLTAAERLAPANPRVFTLRASLLEERGRTWDAIRALERALELRPEYDEARFRAAGLALSSGDIYKAELHYRVLVRRQPGAVAPRLQLADALERQGRVADAEAVLVDARRRAPDNTLAARRLADLYERTGRPKLAAGLRAQLDPSNPAKLRPLKPSRR